jgi:CheY-like chemotaxis protein
MDEKTRRRIFEPFFTTRAMGRATGMGLASAYGIIRNHGGHIKVDSQLGQGTTLHIYLPVSNTATCRVDDDRSLSPDRSGQGTVMMVDDEDMIIDVGAQLLERLGYHAILARSGREAVELFQKHRDQIDVVILDMIMPDMSGSQTFDQLVALQPNVKVILSSGYSLNGEASQILQRGCFAFIQKPYTIDNLARHLQTVLSMERKPA